MDLEKIKEVVKLMQREGISTLKVEGLELSLFSHAFKEPRRRRRRNEAATKDDIETDVYSEEAALFWSSPGYVPQEASE